MAKINTQRLKVKVLLVAILLLASFLCLWRLDQVPVSLFGDELDVGYHAYSILETGRDYSGNFLPLHFQSLAEWRTPLYLYSSVPTVAIFGISPFGVRLPAAIFGILGVWLFYLLLRQITKKDSLAILGAFFLTISPWHIQYSRAGFEVTQMLAFYLAGVYFFLRSLDSFKNKKSPTLFLALSGVFFGLTPWIYSTAKLFLPLTALAIVLIWWRDLFKFPKKALVVSGIITAIVILPIMLDTVFGGGSQRFNYISVFSDPTMEPEIGFQRLVDAKVRIQEAQVGVRPTFEDRFFHNKLTWLSDIVGKNYLQSFSTQFLFINGDLNLRHSIQDTGQFYRFELIFIVLGIIFFLLSSIDKKLKIFLIFWLLASPIPAAITRDGGMHATRLFFMLPMMMLILTFGVYYSYNFLKGQQKGLFAVVYAGVLLLAFVFYQHQFWIHYPWYSERQWHAGFEQAVKSAVREGENYDKVIISMASEPAYIFFLGWSQYPPDRVHGIFLKEKEEIGKFGEISKLDKYYFGTAGTDLSGLAAVLPDKTLYLASEKEIKVNLIQEPERVPGDLVLHRSFPYPSGEPAFYLFSKKDNE